MLPKYTVEYTTRFKRHAQTNHYSTDDPVACEEFVEELLARGFFIHVLASKHICASLGIKPDEEKYRFGFAT
jgi:hypothetical protein